MRYHLIVDAELKREMDAGYAAWKQDPSSDAGKEFMAAIDAMKALREGRESHYQGKQLGYGPGSHDLRDVAELKVPVFDEYKSNGWPLGPSHRLTYREFDPLPRVEGDRVVPDADAQPYRQVVAFVHRADDPAAVTGERLGRQRGMPQRELHGLTGGGRPDVGPQRQGVQTTPHRIPVPPDLIRQAAILRDSPPAGTKPAAPRSAPQATTNRPDIPKHSHSQER